jgi:hypothetical protein
MIWLLFIVIFGIVILLWLPLEVEVDTVNQVYAARWSRLMDFRLIPGEHVWKWQLKVLFWDITIKKDPQKSIKTPEKPNKPAKNKNRKPFPYRKIPAMLKNLTWACRTRQFFVNWDTDDFVLNAWLYPAFRMLSKERRQLFINFLGKQECTIQLYTRPGLLAVAMIRVFLTSKN